MNADHCSLARTCHSERGSDQPVILSERAARESKDPDPGGAEVSQAGSFDSAPRRRLAQDDRSFAGVEKAPDHGSHLVEQLPCLLSFRDGNGASDLQEPQVAIHLFG